MRKYAKPSLLKHQFVCFIERLKNWEFIFNILIWGKRVSPLCLKICLFGGKGRWAESIGVIYPEMRNNNILKIKLFFTTVSSFWNSENLIISSKNCGFFPRCKKFQLFKEMNILLRHLTWNHGVDVIRGTENVHWNASVFFTTDTLLSELELCSSFRMLTIYSMAIKLSYLKCHTVSQHRVRIRRHFVDQLFFANSSMHELAFWCHIVHIALFATNAAGVVDSDPSVPFPLSKWLTNQSFSRM